MNGYKKTDLSAIALAQAGLSAEALA